MYFVVQRKSLSVTLIETADFWLFGCYAMCLIGLALAGWSRPSYSPNSWAYYELSSSLWTGEYSLRHLRNFVDRNDGPTTSFPPLWPFAWSLFSKLGNFGARGGYVLAFFLTFVFGVLSELVGRRLFNLKYVGLFAALFIACTPGYLSEVTGARAIPLQLVLSAGMLLFLLGRPSPSAADAIVLGVYSGALVLCRFDMLPFALALGIGLSILTRSAKAVAAYAAATLFTLSPWIAVSLIWHGKVFATDNAGIALSADLGAFVTDWYPPGADRATLFTDPLAWLDKVQTNTKPFVEAYAWSATDRYGKAVLSIVAIAALVTYTTFGPALQKLARKPEARDRLRAFACVLCAAFLMLPTYIIVGYFDTRYFSLSLWLTALFLIGITATALDIRFQRKLAELANFVMTVALMPLLMMVGVNRLAGEVEEDFPALSEYYKIQSCLTEPPAGEVHRVILTDATLAARLAAVYGLQTSLLPANFRREPPGEPAAKQFIRAFQVAYIGGDSELIERVFPSSMIRKEKRDCGISIYNVLLSR